MVPIWSNAAVDIYSNPAALPRAFYVPQLRVEADPQRLLEELATAGNDPRKVALVETMPLNGFVGSGPGGIGQVNIASDHSEEVLLDVLASADGFVFMSDQDYPGWQATVNGKPTPILRANYVFRAVRVPAGQSTVVFRYRPMSVRLGAVVSLLSAAGCIVFFGWSWSRRRRARATPLAA